MGKKQITLKLTEKEYYTLAIFLVALDRMQVLKVRRRDLTALVHKLEQAKKASN